VCEESGTREAVSGAMVQNLGCSSGQGRLTDIALCSGKSAYHELVQLLRECAGCSALHDSAWNAPSLNGGRAPDALRYKWTERILA